MNICILGWYGTETMGDIAILDGLLRVISTYREKTTVSLGSLFPFFSERTLLEEETVFSKSAPDVKMLVFDVKDRKETERYITASDLVVMGGGPLMDIEEVFLIDYCFAYAHRKGIPTIIAGCGIGPLNNKEYRDIVGNTLSNSTIISFRDEFSAKLARDYYPDLNNDLLVLGDPAIISMEEYTMHQKQSEYAVISLREYPSTCYGVDGIQNEIELIRFIDKMAEAYEEVYLVAMNMFFAGGDDRYYMEKLRVKCRRKNIKVIHHSFNLAELYMFISGAKCAFGMRYHSVVMQTILNGNNYIYDYTDPLTGKIPGFINSLDDNGHFYKDRYINIHTDGNDSFADSAVDVLSRNRRYIYKKTDMISGYELAFKKAVGRDVGSGE